MSSCRCSSWTRRRSPSSIPFLGATDPPTALVPAREEFPPAGRHAPTMSDAARAPSTRATPPTLPATYQSLLPDRRRPPGPRARRRRRRRDLLLLVVHWVAAPARLRHAEPEETAVMLRAIRAVLARFPLVEREMFGGEVPGRASQPIRSPPRLCPIPCRHGMRHAHELQIGDRRGPRLLGNVLGPPLALRARRSRGVNAHPAAARSRGVDPPGRARARVCSRPGAGRSQHPCCLLLGCQMIVAPCSAPCSNSSSRRAGARSHLVEIFWCSRSSRGCPRRSRCSTVTARHPIVPLLSFVTRFWPLAVFSPGVFIGSRTSCSRQGMRLGPFTTESDILTMTDSRPRRTRSTVERGSSSIPASTNFFSATRSLL